MVKKAKTAETAEKKPKAAKGPNKDYAAAITKATIAAIKNLQGGKVWKDLSEGEQHVLISACGTAAFDAVKDILVSAAGQGSDTVVVELGPITRREKDAKGVFTIQGQSDAINDMGKFIGHNVIVVLQDPREYVGKMPKAEKDQPDLPLNETDGETEEETDPDA